MNAKFYLGLLGAISLLGACTPDSKDSSLNISNAPGVVRGDSVGPADAQSKQVVLLLLEKSSCTGTLIAENVVLTAAHCVVDVDIKKSYVAFGTSALCLMDGTCTHSAVESFHPHPDHKKAMANDERRRQALQEEDQEAYIKVPKLTSYEVDVALVKLVSKAPAEYQIFTKFGLPSDGIKTITQIGYGATSSGPAQTNPLRQLFSKDRDLTQISKMDGRSMIVVEQPDGGVCNGDSGGPLLLSSDTETTIGGVVSAGFAQTQDKLCEGGAYYTSLEEHAGWIQETLSKLR